MFLPNGYQVVYHTADKLPTEGHPFFTVDFMGDDGRGPRFNTTDEKGAVVRNTTLDGAVQIAAGLGLDGYEVAGRLGKLFADVNKN